MMKFNERINEIKKYIINYDENSFNAKVLAIKILILILDLDNYYVENNISYDLKKKFNLQILKLNDLASLLLPTYMFYAYQRYLNHYNTSLGPLYQRLINNNSKELIKVSIKGMIYEFTSVYVDYIENNIYVLLKCNKDYDIYKKDQLLCFKLEYEDFLSEDILSLITDSKLISDIYTNYILEKEKGE